MPDRTTENQPAGGPGLPSVAVVIPAKNEAANIPFCMAALASQDYPGDLIQVVLVDNGSTDETCALAHEGGAAVLVDEQATIAGLRNLGAGSHDSQILAFLDADMIPSPHWLTAAVAVLQETGVGAVGGLLDIPDDAQWVERAWCINRQTKAPKGESRWLPSGNLLINRDAFEAVAGFDQSLSTCEDVDICSRLRAAGYRLMYVEKASVVHTGESKSALAMFKNEMWRGKNSIGRLPLIWKNPKEMPAILLPMVQLFLLVLPLALLLSGRFVVAAASLILPLGLPVLRASLISYKLRTIKHYIQLIGVWYIYYLARALAVVFH